MNKYEAIKIFGSQAGLARALGVTPSAISQWPVELTSDKRDRVIGAAVRLNRILPTAASADERQR